MKRLERDGLIVERALLPAPREDTDPCAGQGPHGGLMGLALVTLLLVVPLGPEGMADRLRRPCAARVPEELWTLQAPVPPGLRAAPCGHRGHPGLWVQCCSGGRAGALCAKGDQEAGSADGARSGERLEAGEVGMALGTLRDGGVASGDGLQGAPELGDKGLHQERLGRDDACIGRERGGRCDGQDTLGDDLSSAHVMLAEEGCAGGTAGALHRREGWPATEAIAEDRGIFVLKPLQHMRERVLEGTGQAVGKSHCVADHAATMCDELGEGTHGGALRMEWLQLVAMGAQPCELAGRVRGIVFRPTGCEGVAIPREHAGIEGEEDQKVILAEGGAQGALGECETDGHGVAVEPRAPCRAPRVDGLRGVLELEAGTCCGASGLEADIMCGVRPVKPNKGRKGGV